MRILALIVLLSGCTSAPYISTSTHGSDFTRQIMYQCAAATRDDASYTACLLANKAVI